MAKFVQTANRICRIVWLGRTLRNWRGKARFSSSPHGSPSDVPKGRVAVYVGCGRRLLVHAAYLNHPAFVKLLSQAEEEYGFGHDGPLMIPCDDSEFKDVMRIVSSSVRPFLHGLLQRPVW